MKFLKLDLLTLLISLFLFASCENTSSIGLEVDPSIAIKGTLVDTNTIISQTIKEDATSTLNAKRYPLADFNDPIFGTTEARLAMSVNLPNDGYSFGTSPTLDSAVLVLNYGSEFYGDSTATYSINVNQLSADITQETSFLNTKDDYNYTTLLGTKTTKLYPNTKLKVTDIVTGKPDTLKKVNPQIRIKLDPSLISNKIMSLSTADLKYNANFASAFKGLRLQVSKSTSPGAIMFFDFSNTNSGLMLYYKKQNPTTIDTVAVNFPISSSLGPVAATTKHSYSTAILTQLNNPNTAYPVTYIKPLAGLRNKISFPHLSKFVANVGKIVVNKAELVIDVSAGTDVSPFNVAPRLALYRYDIAERRKNIPDNDLGTSPQNPGDSRALPANIFGGYFNALTKQYVFVVTSYVQDLLDGKTKDYGTFLGATPATEFDIFPTISTGARAVIGSYKKSPAAGDKIMKLNIYYTKIN